MVRSPLERLGPYTLIRNLTRPGRAEVYVGELSAEKDATGKDLPELAVIKVLRPPEQVDPTQQARVQEAMNRFIEEGRLGTRLRHPAIARTYGVALDRRQNQHFIIQEFLDGITLAQVLDHCAAHEQPLSFSAILRMVIPILKALHYAHHDALREDGRPLRVVHRDIKPANVMLTYDGRAILLDLAAARSTSFTRQNTVQDVVLGTAHYLAPEQVFDADTVGHQTDVFAAGVILFELATLLPLLPRTRKLSEIATALSRFRFDDRAEEVDEERYPGLRDVLRRALAVVPGERYSTAGEMARDLEGLLLQAGDGPGLAQVASEIRRAWEGSEDEREAERPAPALTRARSNLVALSAESSSQNETSAGTASAASSSQETTPAPSVSSANTSKVNTTGVINLTPLLDPPPPSNARNWSELVIAALLGMTATALFWYFFARQG